MEAATTNPVPAIAIPEGTNADWAAVWLSCPADQFEALAEKLIEEKDAEWEARFDMFTGEPVKNPRLKWKETRDDGFKVHFELRAEDPS